MMTAAADAPATPIDGAQYRLRGITPPRHDHERSFTRQTKHSSTSSASRLVNAKAIYASSRWLAFDTMACLFDDDYYWYYCVSIYAFIDFKTASYADRCRKAPLISLHPILLRLFLIFHRAGITTFNKILTYILLPAIIAIGCWPLLHIIIFSISASPSFSFWEIFFFDDY